MDTYLVKKGDTISSIASLYNIPAIEIIRLNNLKEPYNIVEGQVLNIPAGTFNIFDYYIVNKNDTLYKIASSYGTNSGTLAAINGLNANEYIYPGQTLLVPKTGILTYITSDGDTISSVASHFKVDPQDVLYSNNSIYLLPDQLVVVYRKIWFF